MAHYRSLLLFRSCSRKYLQLLHSSHIRALHMVFILLDLRLEIVNGH